MKPWTDRKVPELPVIGTARNVIRTTRWKESSWFKRNKEDKREDKTRITAETQGRKAKKHQTWRETTRRSGKPTSHWTKNQIQNSGKKHEGNTTTVAKSKVKNKQKPERVLKTATP